MRSKDSRLNFADLSTGIAFRYRGPRNLALRRTWAFGQVLGLESERGIVHLSTFFEAGADDRFSVAVLHIPILYSAFRMSKPRFLAEKPVFHEALTIVQNWRERSAQGEVGAFEIEIWKIERMIWRTIRDNEVSATLENTLIETAFPKRGSDGAMSAIELIAYRRPPIHGGVSM